jgi:hypothetical protein
MHGNQRVQARCAEHVPPVVTRRALPTAPISPPKATGIVIECCRAFDRDPARRILAPRAMTLLEDGRVAFVDIDIIEHAPQDFGYLAPECFSDNREFDWATAAVFAFATMLWELLAGQSLFARDYADASMRAVQATVVPRIEGIDDNLQFLITRGLHRDPSQRIQTPGVLAALLADYLLDLR